jgi:LPS sulfotransferase NodH
MTKRFDYFVMFAEMRTGSNFLETNINSINGLKCYGEAYNPAFIGYPNKSDLLGVTQAMRDGDPLRLINTMKEKTSGLPGFRFFNNHDARVLEHCLPDPRCAKIILTRNPLDSYVSWKIAQATDQWKLTEFKNQRTAKVVFDKTEFANHLAKLQTFQLRLMKGLQTTGQTAFYIAYEDIPDVDVLNGLAIHLGVEGRIEQISKSLKRQNPASLRDKVSNYDEMITALTDIDHFNLNHTPSFEPRRGPVVPGYIAANTAPLMYLPIKGGPDRQVREWLSAISQDNSLVGEFNQKTLRKWKRNNPGHRSFTVIRHPLVRAHAAFCDYILDTGEDSYPEIRETLRTVYKLSIPNGAVDDTYDRRKHREAFLGFLGFLKSNLNGQTSIRVDPAWCSQSQVLQGFGQFMLPDMVLREDQLEDGLAHLAKQVGFTSADVPQAINNYPFSLSDIYDAEIEAAARDVYQRDYMMFGYRALKKG